MTSNAENSSIWWRHHGFGVPYLPSYYVQVSKHIQHIEGRKYVTFIVSSVAALRKLDAITLTNADLSSIRPQGLPCDENGIKLQTHWLKEMHLQMLSTVC